MKEGDKIPVALEVTVRYINDDNGLLVGFFREFPFITGQGTTFDELVNELQYILGLYFQTFPEANEILVKHGRIIENNKVLDINVMGEKAPPLEIKNLDIDFKFRWQDQKIPLPISQ